MFNVEPNLVDAGGAAYFFDDGCDKFVFALVEEVGRHRVSNPGVACLVGWNWIVCWVREVAVSDAKLQVVRCL